ncbi:MAG TPA: adenine-specific methyltransferase EcoRI family protein [Candidatus Paceibacterota bacterium]|nr:adenine-specific methyltransferase EcoRI family protein [Candidatus Paceibacterota bacterium]
MPKKASNKNLHDASKSKQDEFYTQLNDIANELKHYRSQLKDKVIFCSCDDPFESNFFKYFAANFNALKIKKLITTSYVKSPIAGGQLPLFEIEGLKPNGKEPYMVEINEVPDLNNDGAVSLDDVEYLLKHNKNVSRRLHGDGKYNAGDFRSKECVELLKQADIIVTNPPFSLFREFMKLLVEHNKDFVIIGNKNAITYKDVFRLIKADKLWLGVSHRNKGTGMFFSIPNANYLENPTRVKDGKVFIGGAVWFTTLDTPANHEPITLYKKYTPGEYPKYDNYDAIEVSRTKDIPVDYDGYMGVPITCLNSGYNSDQFEIIGQGQGDLYRELTPKGLSKKFVDTYYKNGGTGSIKEDHPVLGYYDKNGKAVIPYMRIIIKRKK